MAPSLRSTRVVRVVERPEAAAQPGDEQPAPALRVAAYAVVAVDGLKIEPLPPEQSGVLADGARVCLSPFGSGTSTSATKF